MVGKGVDFAKELAQGPRGGSVPYRAIPSSFFTNTFFWGKYPDRGGGGGFGKIPGKDNFTSYAISG